MQEEIIGTTGKLVDLFNENLTQEEWNAICIVHRLGKRLNVGLRFDWISVLMSVQVNIHKL